MKETPLLRMVGITKLYPGVRALDAVDFDVAAGEVHALLGENGAGKSTLIKVLAGAHTPDAGHLELDGQRLELPSPAAATRAGIAVVHQELMLVPSLSVRENLFLGNALFSRLRHEEERHRARGLFTRLGIDIDPEAAVRELSVADQQLVEIAKALSKGAQLLVMDEPTAALSPTEVDHLLAVVEGLATKGIGVIYISHRLEEIERIADRVTVLRDGKRVLTQDSSGVARETWIEAMVGRPLDQEFPPRTPDPGPVRLVARGLARPPRVHGVDLELRAGEVVGLTGLVGAGRTEVARLLFGADQATEGEVILDGNALTLRGPSDAARAGIALVPEDRKGEGLLLDRSLVENFGLANLTRFSSRGLLDHKREAQRFESQADALHLAYQSSTQAARDLSGGNQQKLVLARWLERDADVLLFDEPTRGIDVGARYEIYVLIRELAAQGKALLVISSDLPEVLGVCDRVIVLHEGRVTGERLNDGTLTQEELLQLALGGAA